MLLTHRSASLIPGTMLHTELLGELKDDGGVKAFALTPAGPSVIIETRGPPCTLLFASGE